MLLKKAADARFNKLFTPGYIGDLWVKNRIIRSPMLTNLAHNDGSISQRNIDHYKELARGGAGMVIVEFSYVDNIASKSANGQPGICEASQQPGLYWLANAIKGEGARAAIQIVHSGRQRFMGTKPYKSAFRRAWPDIYNYGGVGEHHIRHLVPDELTIEEIQQIIEDFGDAALRAKDCNFDLVEIHGGHGYLITNFLSPWNQRSDWYGGSFENRKRFVIQVYENVRKHVGPDFPIGIRLSGTDYDPVNPIPIEETIKVAQELESLGINYIHVSGGMHEFGHNETVTMYQPLAYQAWAAERMKKTIEIPVICSGSITTPELAEQILQEGKGDFVGLGRPLIADPYWARKAQEGHPEDIRPCIRCVECTDRGVNVGYITCTVNATTGREGEFCKISKTEKKKKVAIVGGGPAGMEAARVAALKGHDVTLYEKKELGGLLIEASIPEFKSDLKPLIRYFIAQLEKTGVKVLHEEATVAKIKNGEYDAVVVASGSIPTVLDVPGIKGSNVVSALEVLHGAKTGKNVVVVGGGIVGSELALDLAKKGKKVIIAARSQVAKGLSVEMKRAFWDMIKDLPIELKRGQMLTEVTDKGIITLCGSKKEFINGDTVIIAAGFKPERSLFDKLCQIPELEVYAIGDCVKAQTIYDAIHDGFDTAFSLI